MGKRAISGGVLAVCWALVSIGCGESSHNMDEPAADTATTGDGTTSNGSAGESTSTTGGTGGAAATTATGDESGATSSSTSAASTTAGSTGGLELSELPGAFAEAYCSWLYRCCPAAQLEHLGDAPISFYGNSEAECRTNYAALLLLVVPSLTESEGLGRRRYDPVGAQACVDAMAAQCGDPEALCTGLVQSLVPLDGACLEDGDCVGELVCLGETASTDGSCGERLALGEPCDDDSDCQSDQCLTNCVEKAALGATCYVDDACLSAYCDFTSNSCAEAPYGGACTL